MQQRPRQVRKLPTRLADEIATIAGIPNMPAKDTSEGPDDESANDQLHERFHNHRKGRRTPRERFREYLSSTVREAWRGHAVRRKVPRQSDVTGRLNTLLRDLNKLRDDLSALLPEGPNEVAGAFLGATMVPDTVEDWIDSIEGLIERVERAKFNATENSKTKLPNKGAVKGTRGKPAFGLFLSQILTTEEIFGCKWAAYRSEHDERGASGSLVDALDALKPYLPPDFVPKPRTLCRSVAKMRGRLGAQLIPPPAAI